ncbi:protein of unknown function DUF1501 [Chthoniobacter flavus Ellin428]|uniref:Sulfatase n=1 Tax=Chthoniobacter flavus Ellin428 TaxID=497964 RepID=B4D999_9BACT|nr:DUF1501 domain-containing protein [Chthoniobacter flavus]EDY17002.1 protein of unknown function DUF1501 [Chthoniobacter flavus Ellin428]TCO86087.1 uncharacterized protein DUF1501 [Chthoniobacter flavus]
MDINQHLPSPEDYCVTRRQFLNRFGMGFGALSLAGLLGASLGSGSAQAAMNLSPLAPKQPQFPGKAKRVIHIFSQGGPSHIDTWDPKPEMEKYIGKDVKEIGGIPLPTQFKFTKRGQSGVEVSEIFPKIGDHIDDIAVIRSMNTDIPAHDFATLMMNTGSGRLVKPSMGAWVLYGLGAENQNLPGFIALGGGLGGAANWRSAFLPGAFQGTLVGNVSGPVDRIIENIRSQFATRPQQRRQIDLLKAMNDLHTERQAHEAALEARLQSFELAFNMQAEAMDTFDVTKEPQNIRDMYGDTETGRRMLVARRLVENGVRFVQVWAGSWDHHTDVKGNLEKQAALLDQPVGALLTDLKQRGMLEDTLVVWGGEFGRTPRHDKGARGEPGRDHHHRAFCAWMAGGGIKGGQAYGASDDFGYDVVENKVHVHDLHATILNQLGFDHEKLTYRYNGRDFRLTDVFGNVVTGLVS